MNKTRICAALIALFIPLCAPQDAKATGAANVTAVGPSKSVAAGQQFDITINVNPNNNIAGAQFSLSFDPLLVTVAGVTEGSLLKQSGAGTYFVPGQINNQTGTVVGVAAAIVSPGKTVSAPGALAVVTMAAKGSPGTSPLSLYGVIVGDANGKAISVSVANGQVSISAGISPSAPPLATGNSGLSMGGGNGGGGSIPPAAGMTDMAMYTDGSGLFNIAVTTASQDGKAQLEIDRGVQASNKDGSALKSVSITNATDTEVVIAGQTLVGSAYDLGPDGATFNPPVNLSLGYNPSLIPTGLRETSVVIGVWDPTTRKWSKINSQVDSQGHVVKAAVTHFSRYAVIAEARPAILSLSDLSITPQEAFVGDSVTVGVRVGNSGDVSGSYDVVLTVSSNSGGSDTLRQTVEVPGGASREVEFKFTQTVPEQFAVSADGLSGTFTVMARPTLKSNITSTPVPQVPDLSAALANGQTGDLSSGGSLGPSQAEQPVGQRSGQPATASWYVLALFIGASAMVSLVLTVLVLRRRRALLQTWTQTAAK